jgi:hypothetical protein
MPVRVVNVRWAHEAHEAAADRLSAPMQREVAGQPHQLDVA